jgi:hypothetical protein
MARLTNADASYPVQEDVDSIRVDLFEIDDEDDRLGVDLDGVELDDQTDAAAELDAEDVIFDELQTDDAWSEDSTGYNFRYEFAAPLKDKRYEVRVTIVLNSGDTLVARWKLLSE